MSAETIFFLAWLIGGLPVGVIWGVLAKREVDDGIPPGGHALAGWVVAPMIVLGAVAFALAWGLDRVVSRADRCCPSRDQLQRRVDDLERELVL